MRHTRRERNRRAERAHAAASPVESGSMRGAKREGRPILVRRADPGRDAGSGGGHLQLWEENRGRRYKAGGTRFDGYHLSGEELAYTWRAGGGDGQGLLSA